MAMKLYSDASVQAIANAIRTKNGASTQYKIADMAQAILDIPSGGEEPYLYVDSNGMLIVPSGATEYVSDGLIMRLDGIDNTGNGHDASATTWVDLSGNGHNTTVGDEYHVVNDKYVQITRGLQLSTSLSQSTIKHVEIVMKPDSSADPQIIIPGGNSYYLAYIDGILRFSSSATTGVAIPTTNISAFSAGTKGGSGGGFITPYLNGVNATLENVTAYAYNTSNGGRIFSYSSLTANVCAGRVYSVRFYDRTLNAVEIIDNWLLDKKRFGL